MQSIFFHFQDFWRRLFLIGTFLYILAHFVSLPPWSMVNNVSPCTKVTGHTIYFNTHCQFNFRQCAQTDEKHHNYIVSRTTKPIDLSPTVN